MIQFVRKGFYFELDSSGRPTGVKVLSDITDSQQYVKLHIGHWSINFQNLSFVYYYLKRKQATYPFVC